MAGQELSAIAGPQPRKARWRRVIACLPLICLIAVCVAWPLSYRHNVSFHHNPGSRMRLIVSSPDGQPPFTFRPLWPSSIPISVSSGHGRLMFTYWQATGIVASNTFSNATPTSVPGLNYATSAWSASPTVAGTAENLWISYWLLAIPIAVIYTGQLVVRMRNRGRPVGHCPACNYDLRATPDRCPECGLTVARASSP